MKNILILLLIILAVTLTADELADFKFILGLYSDKNYGLAEVEIRKFLKKYPGSNYRDDADFFLATILLEKGNYGSAASIYENLYRNNSNRLIRDDVLLGLAQSLYNLKNYTDASRYLMIFNQEFPIHDSSWRCYQLLGMVARQRGEFERSAQYLDKALELSDQPDIYRTRVRLELDRDKIREAERILADMTGRFQDHPATDQTILIVQEYHLDQEDPLAILRMDHQIGSNSEQYSDYRINRAAAHFEIGNFDTALEELEGLFSERAQYYRALSSMKKGDEKAARSIFNNLREEAGDEEIKNHSLFYSALLEEDQAERNDLLIRFATDNPVHELTGTAYYHIGTNYFEQGNYSSARSNLNKALKMTREPEIREKAFYLTAEVDFITGDFQKANEQFGNYLREYRDGIFRDEALFKTGLYQFDLKAFEEAETSFRQLLADYPESAKSGMSQYYLGEIKLFQKEYQAAKEYYVQALSGRSDEGLIWQRIAEIYYLTGDYRRALNSVDEVPDQPAYLYRKYILRGNINFALNSYETALEDYNMAIEQADNDQEERTALERKARTLYNMERYREATEIYDDLALTGSDDGLYLIQSGNSAFGGGDYSTAIEYYQSYLDDHPAGSETVAAMTGIADSYYNTGDFVNSAGAYKRLFLFTSDPEQLDNALNGLQWSCARSEEQYFDLELQDLLDRTDTDLKKKKILEQKAREELDREDWQQALITLSQLRGYQDNPDERRKNLILQASAYSGLGNYQDAELIYRDVADAESDPEIYRSWARLKLAQNNVEEAIEKYRQASFISREPGLWLEMLELEAESDHDKFLNDQAKFLEFASGRDREKAQIIKIEWILEYNRPEEVAGQIEILQESKYKEIKAHAQYLKGYELYLDGNYDNAVPELLRVRYLYPEIIEARLKAEKIACLAYLKNGQSEEAEQLYESIKDEINDSDRMRIQQAMEEN